MSKQSRSIDEEYPTYPFQREHPLCPASTLTKLQGTGRAAVVHLYNGRRVWLVTRYEDVRLVLGHSGTSNFIHHASLPKLSAIDGRGHDEHLSFLHLDDPRHRELRTPVAEFFLPQRVKALEPRIRAAVDDLIEKVQASASPADFIAVFAKPLPARITCALLGVPDEDADFFDRCTRTSISSTVELDAKLGASAELRTYFADVIRRNQENPGDDILGYLVKTELAEGRITFEDALSTAQLILLGGLETTTNSLALGFMELSKNRALWRELPTNEDLVDSCVEEVLRFHSIFDRGLTRAIDADIELSCGTVIRAGDGVILSLTAANRDPEVFDDPDRFEPRCPRHPHIAFGFGPHFCIGHGLARTSMRIGFSRLAATLPDLALDATPESLEYRDELAIYGPRTLPVRW